MRPRFFELQLSKRRSFESFRYAQQPGGSVKPTRGWRRVGLPHCKTYACGTEVVQRGRTVVADLQSTADGRLLFA